MESESKMLWIGTEKYYSPLSVNRDARIVFRAGENRDGYFTAEDLLKQVQNAMDIFEEKVEGKAVGLCKVLGST